jgi:TPR repeat protein
MIKPLVLSALLLTLTSAASFAQDTEEPVQPAEAIAQDIFRNAMPEAERDYAFGAYQRGYYLTALQLALPRAEQGDSSAQTLIAELYANGLGVIKNPETAAGWYQLASKGGDRLATFALALAYQEGTGVEKDRARAAELFKQAADTGYAPAKYNLALLHIEGVYAAPSLSTAAALMKEAADAELPEAQYDYASMLIEGAGVAPNVIEAAQYMLLAAEQKVIAAQIDYATLLYMGDGVEKNVTEAARWYGRAAEAGNAVAQNRLAKMLAVGEGVPKSLEDAALYRLLARRQGLNDETLDRLLEAATAQDLSRAEDRARIWPSRLPTTPAQNQAEPTAPTAPPDEQKNLPTAVDADQAPTDSDKQDP